jgi:hypothetical protein
LAVDKQQAGIVEKYTRAYFSEIPLLRGLVKRETGDGLELTTGAELDVLSSNFRGVRGRSVALAVLDECAFWRIEGKEQPYYSVDKDTARMSLAELEQMIKDLRIVDVSAAPANEPSNQHLDIFD